MSRLFKFFSLAFLICAALSGCYPGGADFTNDTDVIYTNYDSEYDFTATNTYSAPDKIVIDVEVDDGDTTYVYMKDVYAVPILNRIDENMAALGYQKVQLVDRPDVLIMPAAWTTTSYFYYYWYCWWYGGWYPGWGWYYPPYYSISSYTTGSLVMVMVDPNVNSAIDRSKAAWVAALNGLFSGDFNQDRVLDGIDQAFEQSPYLRTN